MLDDAQAMNTTEVFS